MRLFTAIVLGAGLLRGEGLTIPLEGGAILIDNAQFIHTPGIPELTFTIENKTDSPWSTIKLQFDMAGICNGEPRQWSDTVAMSLPLISGTTSKRGFKDFVSPLVGKVDGCRTQTLKATLVLAENPQVRIDGSTGERIDLEQEREAANAKRNAEYDANVEKRLQRVAIEEEQRRAREAVQAKEKQQRDAERRKLAAEAAARVAKMNALKDVETARKAARVRTACGSIYEATADKKVGNLTVKESEQVKACQLLGLYTH